MQLQVKATGNQGKNEALAWIKGVGKDKNLTACAGSQSWMCVRLPLASCPLSFLLLLVSSCYFCFFISFHSFCVSYFAFLLYRADV
jgi:hypothetical protein